MERQKTVCRVVCVVLECAIKSQNDIVCAFDEREERFTFKIVSQIPRFAEDVMRTQHFQGISCNLTRAMTRTFLFKTASLF